MMAVIPSHSIQYLADRHGALANFLTTLGMVATPTFPLLAGHLLLGFTHNDTSHPMTQTPAAGDNRLLFETLGAGAVAIGLSGFATWLSDVTFTASQRTATAFYVDMVGPLIFTCLAVVRLRRHGASRWSIAGVLLAGLIVTGLLSGVLDRVINCHFGNCTSFVDG